MLFKQLLHLFILFFSSSLLMHVQVVVHCDIVTS